MTHGAGTKVGPWPLETTPRTSTYQMYIDKRDGAKVLVCVVGSTTLLYDERCIADLHATPNAHGGRMERGSADEQRDPQPGTVEASGRSPGNPIGGWYGLRSGKRGRFGMELTPLLEALGLAQVEHNPRNDRMRAR